MTPRQNSGGIKHSPSKMPSVTGAPFPECFETADTTVAEFNAVLARVDADIANNERIFAEMKIKHLENTVTALKTLVEAQRDALANQRETLNKRRLADEKPVVSCYAEMNEIVRTLGDGINVNDADYKAMCLRIALRNVRNLVDVLCEKTDNSGGAVIGVGSRARLDTALEIARTQCQCGE